MPLWSFLSSCLTVGSLKKFGGELVSAYMNQSRHHFTISAMSFDGWDLVAHGFYSKKGSKKASILAVDESLTGPRSKTW